MIRKVIATKDNSKTILIEGTNETYHSVHGALTESQHVFIKNGLNHLEREKKIKVFEMGLGTGLNALLTLIEAEKNHTHITFHSIEKHPINEDIINELEYEQLVSPKYHPFFKRIHQSIWEIEKEITPHFSLLKINDDLNTYNLDKEQYDIIFFDAFGPGTQPELWQTDILKKTYDSLKPKGIFMTYCAQGQFKRNLKSVGFEVENLPGPPGKREITRGIKL